MAISITADAETSVDVCRFDTPPVPGLPQMDSYIACCTTMSCGYDNYNKFSELAKSAGFIDYQRGAGFLEFQSGWFYAEDIVNQEEAYLKLKQVLMDNGVTINESMED
jgi:hypothetical protein